MNHYTLQEWIKFNQDAYSPEKRKLMEEHLQECSYCMDLFLGLIDENEINQAKEIISPDFTSSVMAVLNPAGFKTVTNTEVNFTEYRKKQNLLAYYTAAAILTLVFMGSGVFQTVIDSCSNANRFTDSHHRIEDKLNIDLSQKITDRTSQWIYAFENPDKKEVK